MAVVELNCGIFLKFWISEFQFCILHLCCSPVGTIIRTFYHSFMFILKFYICVLPYWCILHLFCVCTYLCALYILVSYTFFVFYIFSFAAAMFSCSFHQNFLLWGFPKTLFVTFYPELQVYTILFHLCFWASVVFESFRSEPSIRVIHGDKWKKLSKTFQIISETFEIISNHFRNISNNCATRTLRSMIHLKSTKSWVLNWTIIIITYRPL